MKTPVTIPFAAACLFALGAAFSPAAERPNLVVFLSDDHTWRDSTVYGSTDIDTPNMARVAAEGMVFDRAYVASPSCAPSRAALLTGKWPARNGAEANHTRPREEIRKLPAYLQELGYEVVSFGKVAHYRHTPEYGFDIARHYGYHEDVAVPEAVAWLRQRRDERPLCLFVGSNWPHVPWPEDTEGIDPGALVVPPHHVDSDVSRQWRARYVAAIRIMDGELGLVYDTAREVLGDDFFFLHTSDHGAQWPYAKWTLYEDGVRTPFFATWPGRIEPGSRTEAMVSWIDILPTLVDAAGGGAPEGIDGRSFLPVLEGREQRHRDRIFLSHSGDGNNNVFPTRAVVDESGWKLIHNLRPELRFLTHVTKNSGDSGYWDNWLDRAVEDAEGTGPRRIVREFLVRPESELFDTANDPWERENLADDPVQAERVEALSIEIEDWMEATGDLRAVYGEPIRRGEPGRPNIVFVFVDDLGWSDLSCFGSSRISTPNIDRLAAEGLRFERFYVNSPICSPSRVAATTGQYPHRWRITSFLNNRRNNHERGVAQWLDPAAPVLARELRRSGYATGHFGKWHMGGQRDVDNAPPIADYGFDRSLANFEGMGHKLLPLVRTPQEPEPKRIWADAVRLGRPAVWTPREEITGGFAAAALRFIDRAGATDQPFYVNVWPDDPHGPWFPSLDRWSEDRRERYEAVVEEMDAQLGPLFDRIRDDPALRDNTLIVFCSDNGPEMGVGSAEPLRGGKTWLYEGGIRSPLVVWGPGLLADGSAGAVNRSSVLCSLDLNRSLYRLAGIPLPEGHQLDGEDLLDTLLGNSQESRKAPIFFRRPPDRPGFGHGSDEDNPDLAAVEGNWKYLVNLDLSNAQLYDIADDPYESSNLVEEHPETAARLREAVLDWNSKMPADAGDPAFAPGPLPPASAAKGGKGKGGKAKGKGKAKAGGKGKTGAKAKAF